MFPYPLTFPPTQTTTSSGNSNCFDVYEVWTTSKSDLITINHGTQISDITLDTKYKMDYTFSGLKQWLVGK